jgi:hypothetical protein
MLHLTGRSSEGIVLVILVFVRVVHSVEDVGIQRADKCHGTNEQEDNHQERREIKEGAHPGKRETGEKKGQRAKREKEKKSQFQ